MPDTEKKEMSFLDHLEELRKRLFRAMIPVVFFTIIAFLYMDTIFKYVIIAPTKPDFWTYRMLCKLGDKMYLWFGIDNQICVEKIDFALQSRTLTGQFTMYMTSGFVAGFVMAFPFFFWQLWKFIEPALNPTERSNARGGIAFVSILFFVGILFGYYILSPLSINFLANFKIDESINNYFDVTSYISTLLMMILGCGIMFQLPVVVYILSRLGIMTPGIMRKYRRHAIVVILIVAAVLTPTPDFLTQTLVGTPIIILYELSIFISAAIERKKKIQLTKAD
ncbi:MAG TPA: twin-arginine translocase subunit TatC [Cytophagaceae bacterium]|nr:twin-arginine translocase subunit TatC [Cytophagaceae bacterium]